MDGSNIALSSLSDLNTRTAWKYVKVIKISSSKCDRKTDKMQGSKKSSTPPRSRRSNINLADLRVSPLSTKYPEPPKDSSGSNDDPSDLSFLRGHSSYIQGKSAPTTPGILSRSSSRKTLGAGLRRTSIYDDDVQTGDSYDRYEYAGVVQGKDGSARVEVGSGQIPKAKSEAALLVQRSRFASKGVQLSRQKQYQYHARSRTGENGISRGKSKLKLVDEDWLTRTGAAANAILQESKGQSWIVSRESSTSLIQLQDTTDEEDEGYEELAAQSASASRRQLVDDELSPVSTRASRWGSRYGSRTASRRTSRRGSVSLTTGSRTPLAPQGGQDSRLDYFEDATRAMAMEPEFIDEDDETDGQGEATLKELTESRSFGLGGIVDRIMNFSLFNVEEKEEATEDEADRPVETEAEAKERRAAENRRKREEKEKLTNRSGSASAQEVTGHGEGGWADAAWLFSVASRAIF